MVAGTPERKVASQTAAPTSTYKGTHPDIEALQGAHEQQRDPESRGIDGAGVEERDDDDRADVVDDG